MHKPSRVLKQRANNFLGLLSIAPRRQAEWSTAVRLFLAPWHHRFWHIRLRSYQRRPGLTLRDFSPKRMDGTSVGACIFTDLALCPRTINCIPGLRGVRNRREKRALVERGCSHGILVYTKRRASRMVPVRPRRGASSYRQQSQVSRACPRSRHRETLENHLLPCR